MRATDKLRAEHERILGSLDVLEDLAARAREGAADADRARDVLDFLRTFADQLHHAKEEQMLFPALGEAGMPPEGGPVGMMLMEHDEGRRLVEHMAGAVEEQLGSDAARSTFAQAAGSFVQLLRDHIAKENEILFPLADQMLSEQSQSELAAGFERFDEQERAEEHRRCRRLLDGLAGFGG